MRNIAIDVKQLDSTNLRDYISSAKKLFLQTIDTMTATNKPISESFTEADIFNFNFFFTKIKNNILNIDKGATNKHLNAEELANKFIQWLLLIAIQRDFAFLTLQKGNDFFIPDHVRKDPDFLKDLKTYYYKSIAKDVVLFSIGPVLSTLGILALTGTFTIAPWLTILLISTGIVSSLLGLIPARHAIKFHQEMSIFNSKKQDNEEIIALDGDQIGRSFVL